MIASLDACHAIEKHRGDAVVVTTQTSGHLRMGWPAVSHAEELDFPLWTAMGKASSIGLGIAIAQPQKKVLVLDGDGSLLMNLGTLATISEKAPQNLYHFIFDNGVYAGTGGQPIPGKDQVSFKDLASAAGYSASYQFADLQKLTTNMERILGKKGPVFVSIKIVPEIDSVPNRMREQPSRTMLEAIAALRRTLISTCHANRGSSR